MTRTLRLRDDIGEVGCVLRSLPGVTGKGWSN